MLDRGGSRQSDPSVVNVARGVKEECWGMQHLGRLGGVEFVSQREGVSFRKLLKRQETGCRKVSNGKRGSRLILKIALWCERNSLDICISYLARKGTGAGWPHTSCGVRVKN